MRLMFLSCSAALLLATAAGAPQAQQRPQARPPEQVQVNDLLSEIQVTSGSTSTLDLVWWMPPAFWDVSLAQQGGIPDDMRAEINALFSQYVVLAAVSGSMGNLGAASYMGEAELRDKLVLVAPDGSTHRPLPPEDVDPRMAVLVGALKPMFASTLGPVGSNLNFYAFPGRAADGTLLVDPLSDGTMTVRIAETEYPFRLPLASLLAPARDPATGEEFPGNYRFNPFTGAPLQAAQANRPGNE